MAQYIGIYTDSNRTQLLIKFNENQNFKLEGFRLVYREIHETEKTAHARLSELQSYTRMQLEKLVRRDNPNWLNLLLTERDYHPGAKLSPKVPNLTSLRWKGIA